MAALRLTSSAAFRVSTASSASQQHLGLSTLGFSSSRAARVPLAPESVAAGRFPRTVGAPPSFFINEAGLRSFSEKNSRSISEAGLRFAALAGAVPPSPIGTAARHARSHGVPCRLFATVRDGSATAKEVSLVQGASRGIGLELARQLLQRSADSHVIATCRDPAAAAPLRELQRSSGDRLTVFPLDVTDEASIEGAARHVAATWGHLNLLINASGLLHVPGTMKPETSMKALTPQAMLTSFQVNAMGPALVIKHMAPLLAAGGGAAAGREVAVAGSISARVSSIGDNRLGGWHSYRASKAALNQLVRTMSIELAAKKQPVSAVLLHPGTVDTDLSKPFQTAVPPGKLFTREFAAHKLLGVVGRITAADNGKFFAWDGQEIPW
ncbi:hypothetical protein CLOM_g12059 [Closterium sp. NIES-68]|nr:hypothetical protein CLOM_g12059 [Closterium sp. NIES-68]GJP57972.1 hypothetical protein CLOP_g19888 [Closterium sp. NIES-67]